MKSQLGKFAKIASGPWDYNASACESFRAHLGLPNNEWNLFKLQRKETALR